MTEVLLVAFGGALGSVVAVWARNERGHLRRLPISCAACLALGILTGLPFREAHFFAFAGYGLLTTAAPLSLASRSPGQNDAAPPPKLMVDNAKAVALYAAFGTGLAMIGFLMGFGIGALYQQATWEHASNAQHSYAHWL
jgi:hypothetical protein